ncbi:hypothetical protein CR513_51403, partial [Mucuna pruriens]
MHQITKANYSIVNPRLNSLKDIVHHLSCLDQSVMQPVDNREIKETFLDECLLAITSSSLAPWFIDIVKYITGRVFPPNFIIQEKRKLLSNVKHYLWDDRYLFKICGKMCPN